MARATRTTWLAWGYAMPRGVVPAAAVLALTLAALLGLPGWWLLPTGIALGLGIAGAQLWRPPAPPRFDAVVAGLDTSLHAAALWDAEGQLIRCNPRYNALFPGPPPRPGRAEVELPDGSWVMASLAKLPGGAVLGLYTEVTALKRAPPAVPAPVATRLLPPLAPPLRGGKLRLLGVDDSPANLSVLRALLSNTGFAFETVTEGRAALETLQQAAQAGTPFDAVLMDVMMPGMDGLECTRRIRALPGALGLVPVIPVTASRFPEDIAACHAAGMTGHVPKPVERTGLMRGIALALRCGDRPEEEALRPLFLCELANRLRELDAALAQGRPLLAPVHAIAGTVGHLGGAVLVDEARATMRALRDERPDAREAVAALLARLRAAYPVGG